MWLSTDIIIIINWIYIALFMDSKYDAWFTSKTAMFLLSLKMSEKHLNMYSIGLLAICYCFWMLCLYYPKMILIWKDSRASLDKQTMTHRLALKVFIFQFYLSTVDRNKPKKNYNKYNADRALNIISFFYVK